MMKFWVVRVTNATTVDFTTGTLVNLETLTGSNGNDLVTIDGATLNQFERYDFEGGTGDVLQITSTSTTLNGLFNSRITGLEEISAIGAAGDVTIDISRQNEDFTLRGSDNNDTLTGGDGDDTIFGEAGDDILIGGDGADTLDGGEDNDTLIGGAGADNLNGGDGNDLLHGNGLTQAQIDVILTANPDVIYSAATNSFYEFVASGATWTASQTAAAATSLNGVSGHLATISSLTELNYLDSQVNPTNSTAIGSYFTSGSEVADQDQWIFTDGIEAGLQFWQGAIGGASVNGIDPLWAGGQPNSAVQNYVYLWSASDGIADSENTAFAHGEGYIVEWEAGLMNDDNAIDTIDGGAGNDQIYGYGGNDLLTAGAGDDVLFGGAGNDTLNGGTGDDSLFGGDGNDTLFSGSVAAGAITDLNGQDGLDDLYGAAGTDHFIFESLTAFNNIDRIYNFNTGHSDAIDISDVLVGYDSATDDITEWVRITSGGGNSTLAVDANGLTGGSSFISIATIFGVTGLTNEAALEASGNLIT